MCGHTRFFKNLDRRGDILLKFYVAQGLVNAVDSCFDSFTHKRCLSVPHLVVSYLLQCFAWHVGHCIYRMYVPC